jgi:iron complex outermembrane receptor protein
MKQKSAEIMKSNTRHATDSINPLRLSAMTLAVISVLSSGYALAEEQSTASNASGSVATLEKVVVTSRNREEIAQDVPLPVQVLGGAQLDRENIRSVWDVATKAPNLQLNPTGENARKVAPSIRGLGKGSANDSMERSVGMIVDGVSLYYSGQGWADYVDLDRIEILRGPQGTLIGKNSSLGAIKIVTKAPSFQKASSYEITTGSLNTLSGKFSSTGPLIDGLLAYRGTFSVDRQDGIYDNTFLNFGNARETWQETNKLAGRVQLLWTPSADLSGRLILDKQRSDERTNTGSVIVSNGPATYADGTNRASGSFLIPGSSATGNLYTPTGSYVKYGNLGKWAERSAWFHNRDGSVYQPQIGTTNIDNSEARPQISNQHGISGELNWTVADHTLTSLTAYRYQDFDIKNGGNNGPYYIGNSGQQLWNKQLSQELRIASLPEANKKVDYQAGLYYLNAEVYSDDPTYYGPDAGAWNATLSNYTKLIKSAAGRELLRASLDGVYQSTVTDAKTNSLSAYGQADWHFTDQATLSFGLRQTKESKNNRIEQQLDRAGENLSTLGTAVGATAAEITAAQQTRDAAVNAPFASFAGTPIDASLTAWNVGPSYKVNDDVLVYTSVGQGIKSGFIFFQPPKASTTAASVITYTTAGFESQIKPEKTLDYELGAKTLLLDRKLQLNANLYYTQVTDYQATWTRTDTDPNALPGATITAWGNAEKVLARGLELESAYQVNNNFSLNANGAYNRVTYETQWLLAKPELSTTTYFDAKGQQIAGAPLITLNYGGNYKIPLSNGLQTRFTLSNSFKSGFYFNDNHSENTYQNGYTVTNLGIGFGPAKGDWEFSLLAKNLLNTDYAISKATWTGTAAQTQNLGAPRYIGVTFKAKL